MANEEVIVQGRAEGALRQAKREKVEPVWVRERALRGCLAGAGRIVLAEPRALLTFMSEQGAAAQLSGDRVACFAAEQDMRSGRC